VVNDTLVASNRTVGMIVTEGAAVEQDGEDEAETSASSR
jgi:hypothetical protein